LRSVGLERTIHPDLIFWIIWPGGLDRLCLLPWYGVEGFWSFELAAGRLAAGR
jgi:iron(III) transport system permease protein